MANVLIEAFIASKSSGLLMDLDNTIYPYDPTHAAALLACRVKFDELNCHREFIAEYENARHMVHNRLKGQAAMHSRLLYFQQMFENIYQYTKSDLSLEFEEIYWGTFLEKMTIDQVAFELLQFCKKESIPVCIVTDLTTQIQHRKIVKLNLQHLINYMVSSEEAGIEKPHAQIFNLAIEKIGIPAQQLLMVGDSIKKDIEGARAAGINAIHYIAA
jgi:putative hydrolase of the HAD superfamily